MRNQRSTLSFNQTSRTVPTTSLYDSVQQITKSKYHFFSCEQPKSGLKFLDHTQLNTCTRPPGLLSARDQPVTKAATYTTNTRKEHRCPPEESKQRPKHSSSFRSPPFNRAATTTLDCTNHVYIRSCF